MDEVVGPVMVPEQPPTFEAYITPALQPVPVLPSLALLLAVVYLAGVARLWRSGRRWPVFPTLSFLAGCATIAAVTGLGLEGYGLRMFSVFMFQQLTLMLAAPPLLILGQPGRLLLRALPHNRIGRVGLRVAFWGLRSVWGRLALHPAVTVLLFLVSFYGLYLWPLADRLLRTWAGHTALELFFLVVGVLFAVPLLSNDPLPRRQGSAGRAVDLFAGMALHAFFGVIVMMTKLPLVGLFAQPPSAWRVDPVADQQVAGALAWSYGELPDLIILLVIVWRWQRDEDRQNAAADRRIASEGDLDLDAYNAYLHRLHEQPPARTQNQSP